jgi:long-chain fatty acid transport protein
MGSFYHEFCDYVAILGNIGWQNWEQFGKVDIIVGQADPRSFTDVIDFRDTWHTALGAQFTILTTWRFSLGTAYDSDMVENSQRPVSLPIGSAWRLGTGLEYFAREDFTVGVAYTRIIGGNLGVNQRRGVLTGRVAGDYDNTTVNYFGVNFDWIY